MVIEGHQSNIKLQRIEFYKEVINHEFRRVEENKLRTAQEEKQAKKLEDRRRQEKENMEMAAIKIGHK